MDYTTALSTLSILPNNKEQVKVFTRQLKDEILANTKDPLKILVQLKFIEKVIADVLKDEELDYYFLKEFLLFDKDEKVVVNGSELRSSEVGVKYHYEDSGDPIWTDLQKQSKILQDKIKEREKFLQNIPYNEGVVEPVSGVFMTRPGKSSHSKVIVKL